VLIRLDTYITMSARKGQTFTLKAAAEKVGVAPITLKRWLLDGKVAEVARDRNGWRAFSEADIERIRRYALTLRAPEEG
jgi:predicted site-specific integrase-resolvase